MALVDDFVIPSRRQLVGALANRARPWATGPFGESARALLAEHTDEGERVLDRYDQIAGTVSERSDRRQLTHGEPHQANTITTDDGVVLWNGLNEYLDPARWQSVL